MPQQLNLLDPGLLPSRSLLTLGPVVGIVALALVLSPTMQGKGAWTLIPAEWHEPLEQAYVITRRAAANPLAGEFAAFMASAPARAVMRRYGFVLPDEEAS